MGFLKDIYKKLPIIKELNCLTASILETSRVKLAVEFLHYENAYKNSARASDKKRLCDQLYSINSQSNEDGIINEIFKRIGFTNKKFIEVGVGDGLQNNTAFLLSTGWSGIWVDANDSFLKNPKIKNYIKNSKLKTKCAFVNKENIVNLLDELQAPSEIDLLSLDIDQNTYYIWESLASVKARVVVVEYNAFVPPNINWKVKYDKNLVWDGSKNFGASLKAYELLGLKMGYNLVGCDFGGNNAFFIQSHLTGDRFCEPFTAENHFEPPRLFPQFAHKNSLLDCIE